MPKKNKISVSKAAESLVSAPVVIATNVPTTKYCSKCQGMTPVKDGACTICSNPQKLTNEELMKKQDEETTKRMSVSEQVANIKDEDEEENDDPSPSDLEEKEDGRRVERVIYETKEECLKNPLVSKRMKKNSTSQQPHEVSEGDTCYGWVWAPNGELAIAYVARMKKGWKATTGNRKGGVTKEEMEKKIVAERQAAADEMLLSIPDNLIMSLPPEMREMVKAAKLRNA